MCQPKADGPRCFHHGYEKWTENADRIERDHRILRNGQELTDEEKERLDDLSATPEALTRKERNELSILQRIALDNQKLTDREVHFYKQNLATRDSLDADLNTTAVAQGAVKQKELSLLYGDFIKEFVEHDPATRAHPRKGSIAEFLKRLAADPDSPLTEGEERLADELYNANPEFFNARHSLMGGNGHSKQLSVQSYAELRELVKRYRLLHPRYAPKEQQTAHRIVTVLRSDEEALSHLLQDAPLSDEVVQSLPAPHRDVHARGKATPRLFTLALAQDKRVALHGLYAREAEHAFPKLFKNSDEHGFLDEARVLAPKVAVSPEALATRKKELAEWERRIRKGEWASRAETRFETASQVAELPVSSQPEKVVLDARLETAKARRTDEGQPATSAKKPVVPAVLKPTSTTPATTPRSLPHAVPQPAVLTPVQKVASSAPTKPATPPTPAPVIPHQSAPVASPADVERPVGVPAPVKVQGDVPFLEWMRRQLHRKQ